jgi:large subunit ribosomal protein L17
MRHRKRRGQLKVSPSHHLAMRRNMVLALVEHGRIQTTLAKAKAFRSFAEKVVTAAVKGIKQKELGTAEGKAAYLHAVRRVAAMIPHKPTVKKLFEEVAPAVGDRPGGYTRILRYDKARLGDKAPLALFELVDREVIGVDSSEQAGELAEAGAES